MKFIKSIKLWLLFVAVLPFLGCKAPSSHKKVTLLLDWWANPNHIPIYAGIEKGFFAKQGIELEILTLQEPPDSLIYVLANQVDVALYYMPHCFRGYAHSPNFKVIGKLIDEPLFSFICRKDAGIESIKDFQGKSLGIFSDCISRAVLTSLNNGVQFGSFKTLQFDLATVLYTKSLDIISGVYWNIEPFQLESKGVAVKSFRWTDFNLPSYPELVFISNNSFLRKNPAFSKHFKKALHESISYALKKPEEAFELYLKQNPGKHKEASWEKTAWDATYTALAKSQDFNLENLKTFYKWLDDSKILCREFDVDELLE